MRASCRLQATVVNSKPTTRGRRQAEPTAAQFNVMAAGLEAAARRGMARIGDVAHGLQTPLTTIEGYVEGLLDGVVEPEPETWAVLHAEVGWLRRLVTELQELSHAEVRQLPVHLVIGRRAGLVAQVLAHRSLPTRISS
jgi:signal transduction histidine kinase